MSVIFYDKALVKKFKRWTEGTDITVIGPDESRRMFEILADKTNDSTFKLPLISIRRNLGYTIDAYGKKFSTYNGFRRDITTAGVKYVNIIPVTLNYQVDVYTRYYEEAEDYMRNLIFNIINYPKFEVEIPYMDIDMQHVSNILPGQEVTDNSGSSERLFPGQFTRLTYAFTVDEAFLWDVREKNSVSISVGDLHIITKINNEDIVEKLDIPEKKTK